MKRKLIDPKNTRLIVDHTEKHEKGRPWTMHGVMFRVEDVEELESGLFRYNLRIADSSLEVFDELENRLYGVHGRDIDALSAAAEQAYKRNRVLPAVLFEPESGVSAEAVNKLSFSRRVFQMARYLEGRINAEVYQGLELARNG